MGVGDGPDNREAEPVPAAALHPLGLDAQASTGLRGLPLTPWQGLGVVALWAAGALVLGGLVLCRRDA